MTTRRPKKITKLRGSRTCAGGHVKKRRGAGSRGGRGNAGLMKHKKSLMIKLFPNHFGRYGFKRPQKVRRINKVTSIKLRDIDIITSKMGINEIDMSKFGYNKVLAGGKLTKPLTIKAKVFSKSAKERIEQYGGKIIEG